MVSKNLCILVHRTKVALALEGLNIYLSVKTNPSPPKPLPYRINPKHRNPTSNAAKLFKIEHFTLTICMAT